MFTQLRPAGSRRQALDDFAKLLFGQLPRADQREWANTYLRGLLCTTGKKSMRRLAESVSTSPTAWYSLQQFISGSSWDWEEPRGELARWVDQRASVRAWTVATATMPKRGDQSVGVHRRFIPSVGRTVNCQLGTALFLSCPGANFPTDWRLHLPTEWAADRRTQLAAARIPEDVTPSRCGRTRWTSSTPPPPGVWKPPSPSWRTSVTWTTPASPSPGWRHGVSASSWPYPAAWRYGARREAPGRRDRNTGEG